MKTFFFAVLLSLGIFSCSSRKTSAVLEIVFYQELTDSFKIKLSKGLDSELRKAGWVFFPDRIELNVLPKEGAVFDRENNIIQPQSGRYDFTMDTVGATGNFSTAIAHEWVQKNGGVYLHSPRFGTKEKSLPVIYFENEGKIKVYERYAKYECCMTLGENAEGDPMNDKRCLDYNGNEADGVNRRRNESQAYINFINSDCYMALIKGNCVLEHLDLVNGCQANHGGMICSDLIGHSPDYHVH